jgi:hypothetical protein
VNRPPLGDFELRLVYVKGLAQHVEDVALDAVTNRNGDGGAGVLHCGTADQAVGCLQGDGTHQVVAQVLRGFKCDGARLAVEGHLGGQRIVDGGNGVSRELDVDNRADDTGYAAGRAGGN